MSARLLLAVVLAMVPRWVRAGTPAEGRFFNAVRVVEGGTRPGDHGRAIGPYQIHRGYWRDALRTAPELRGHTYAECTHEWYGRLVVRAYLSSHASAAWRAGDWHALAWLHHSGARGVRQRRGEHYADRVVAIMEGGR